MSLTFAREDFIINTVWGSHGFDGDFESGEASRCDPLIAKLI